LRWSFNSSLSTVSQKQRRRPAVARDEMQRERALVVAIEICPIHRHDNIAPRPYDLGNP
jgi:hypothetical protein